MCNQMEVKIILLGNTGVGKTSILERLQNNVFVKNQNKISFIEYYDMTIEVKGLKVKLSIYDTNGQERYHAMLKSYYRHAEGALLVYSVVDVASFMQLSSWLLELRNENPDAEVLVAGNQNDNQDAKAVFLKSVKDFCVEESLDFIEMSALTGENVESAFHRLGELILMKKGMLSPTGEVLKTYQSTYCQTENNTNGFKLEAVQPPTPAKKGSCC